MNTPKTADPRIADNLKRLRVEKAKLSVEDVVELLAVHGFDISTKTLYAYENRYSTPNADLFLELCKIYDVRNILKEFGYGDVIMPDLSGEIICANPLINAVYKFCEKYGKDFSQITSFLLLEDNTAHLNILFSGRGVSKPLKDGIESVCGASIKQICLDSDMKEDELLPFTLSRSEISAALAFREQQRRSNNIAGINDSEKS